LALRAKNGEKSRESGDDIITAQNEHKSNRLIHVYLPITKESPSGVEEGAVASEAGVAVSGASVFSE